MQDLAPLVNAAESYQRPGLSYSQQGKYAGFNPFFAGNQEAPTKGADWNWLSLYISTLQTSITNGSIPTTASFVSLTTSTLILPALTKGSVLFAGAGGLVSQNNASFFWDNTNDTLKIGASPSYPNGTTFVQMPDLNTTVGAKWRMGLSWFDNMHPGGDLRQDTYMNFGYNFNPVTASQDLSTEPSWGWQLETYENVVSPGNPAVEGHLQYLGAGGTPLVRPWSCRVVRGTNLATITISADQITFNNTTDTGSFLTMYYQSGTRSVGVNCIPIAVPFQVNGTTVWQNTGGAANNTLWDTTYSGNSILYRAANDAYNAATAWLTVARSANTISSLTWGGPHLNTDGTFTNPSLSYSAETNTGWYRAAAGYVSLSILGAQIHQFNATHYALLSNSGQIQLGASQDVILNWDASAVLSLKNGTAQQEFRVYGSTTGPTYTSISNDTGSGRIKGNTGCNMILGANNTDYWYVASASGDFIAITDNANNIGNAGANRPKGIYVSSQFAHGNSSTPKIGFFAATLVGQQTAAGASGYADSGVTVVHSAGTFTGGVGSTAYTIGDIVAALKNYGLLVT